MKKCTGEHNGKPCTEVFEHTPDYAIAHLDTDPGGWPFSGFYWNCPKCGTTLMKPFDSLIKSFVEVV